MHTETQDAAGSSFTNSRTVVASTVYVERMAGQCFCVYSLGLKSRAPPEFCEEADSKLEANQRTNRPTERKTPRTRQSCVHNLGSLVLNTIGVFSQKAGVVFELVPAQVFTRCGLCSGARSAT